MLPYIRIDVNGKLVQGLHGMVSMFVMYFIIN
jgi:hypothetical protein